VYITVTNFITEVAVKGQFIYKIVNTVNGKFYVGSTTNTRERFRTHRNRLRKNRHHAKHLQAAWNKYGEKSFVFVVIEAVPEGESLQAAEDKWLVEHVGQEYCYNKSRYSDTPMRGIKKEDHPSFGRPKTEIERQAISTTLKKFYAEDITNHPRFGKKHTEEAKERIRQKKLANPTRAWLGKERSNETKDKISAAQKDKPKGLGRKVSAEGMAKIRANIEAGRSHKHWAGKQHTAESKAKMSKPVFVLPDGIMFPSLTLVLKYYDIKMPTLNRALKSGKPISRGKLTGYVFSYGGIGVRPTENDIALINAKLLDTPQKEA
jgi:group I intron endonuclease